MMEAEASSSLSSSQPQVFSSGQNDVVRDLLTLARQLITQGKASEALQAVIFLLLFSFQFLFHSLYSFEFFTFKISSLILFFVNLCSVLQIFV